MAIDPRIEEAIKAAVTDAGQSTPLARKIIAWTQAVVAGNEDLNDVQRAAKHLELLFNETADDVQENSN